VPKIGKIPIGRRIAALFRAPAWTERFGSHFGAVPYRVKEQAQTVDDMLPYAPERELAFWKLAKGYLQWRISAGPQWAGAHAVLLQDGLNITSQNITSHNNPWSAIHRQRGDLAMRNRITAA
jgi:hypothetical protein